MGGVIECLHMISNTANIKMKTIRGLVLLTVIFFESCIGQISRNELPAKLPPYKTFYWVNNSESEFHANNFDSTACNLFSFGPEQLNSRQRLQVINVDNALFLINTLTKKKTE
jgi:hypothetical protein